MAVKSNIQKNKRLSPKRLAYRPKTTVVPHERVARIYVVDTLLQTIRNPGPYNATSPEECKQKPLSNSHIYLYGTKGNEKEKAGECHYMQ